MRTIDCIATAALATLACAAMPAHGQHAWGGLYPSVLLTSDYRYDGTSFSGHEPTIQGSLFWARPDRFYAGVWMSGVDFSDLGDATTSYEVDVYGGYRIDAGATRVSFEAMYSAFPDSDVPGPTYDFFTAKVRAERSFEALSISSELSWVPEASYGAGTAWRMNGNASYRLNDWLTTSAGAGRRWSQTQRDRSFWNLGATARWNSVSFDLRYFDTNTNFVECGFVDWCDAGVTLTLQMDLWE